MPTVLFNLARGLNLEDMMLMWAAQYGKFFEWQLPGSFPVVMCSDPAAIRQAFEVDCWPKSPLYADLLPVLGEHSMVTSEGAAWRSQRNAFNPGFSSAFLRSALPGFLDCTQRLAARLDRAAGAGEVVRMHELAILTTLEVICQVGFGERVDLLLGEGAANPLWLSFEALGRHVAFFLDNIPLNRLKLLPWNQAKTRRLQADLDEQLLAILHRRLAAMGIRAGGGSGGGSSGGGCPFHATAPTGNGSAAATSQVTGTSPSGATAAATAAAAYDHSSGSARDILSLAVELSAQGGGPVDEGMLLSQMKTFFAAGHDTTASLVAWAVWYLCTHPEVEARLVAELQAVQAGGGGGSDGSGSGGGTDAGRAAGLGFSWQQLQECSYLNAVLKETLRVRPPVGIVARHAPAGATLGGYDVSRKIVLVSPFVLHRAAEWGPDAAQWRPERWLENGGAGPAAAANPHLYMPFSRGPRDCIGSRFALLEAKTILAVLYSRFEFEYAGDRPEQVMMSVTAHPRFGVPLRVRRRQAAAAEQAAAAVSGAGAPA